MTAEKAPNRDADEQSEETPFVDTSGEDPTVVDGIGGRCYGSTADGGECAVMGLSFDGTDEWREHRDKHHPVGCSKLDCSILSAYKKDNSPSSYCYKHIPDDPDVVFAWRRTNTKSVVRPPRADEDHPIEANLPDGEERQLVTDGGQSVGGMEREPIQQRGIYLMADTPLTAHPLALEDGSGDKQLLADALADELTDEEVDDLINELISRRVNDERDGTAIECEACGHVRETSEENPTLVNCEQCGSYNLRYVDTATDHPDSQTNRTEGDRDA